MSFGGSGGVGDGAVGTATDVFVSSLSQGEVLEWNDTTAKWNNHHLNQRIQDVVGAMITAGAQVTVNYDETARTLTIASTAQR